MCTLIGIWKSVPGYDLVIGMNRDESASRAADPPSVIEGAPVVVAPRDRKAGGTWIGASGTGLVVALSNRRGRASATARSRGQLVLDALRQPNVAGVDVFLQREVREHEYNFWNLFVASKKEVRFFRYDGELSMTRGHEGLNVLTNEGGNIATDPKVQFIQGILAKVSLDSEEVVRSLQRTLRTHAAGPGGIGLCVHGPGGGTVSSTTLALSNADPGENVLLYADGPPCTTPYRENREVIRSVPSPNSSFWQRRKGFPRPLGTTARAGNHGRPRPCRGLSDAEAGGLQDALAASPGAGEGIASDRRSPHVPRSPRRHRRGASVPDQLRRSRGDGLHRGREPLHRGIRPRGPQAFDPVRFGPSETDEGCEAGRGTTRLEMGDGRHEDPSAPSALPGERIRGRTAAFAPHDLQNRGAASDARHGPHRNLRVPGCAVQV